MKFKVGDKVFVLDDDISGIVTSVNNSAIGIITVDGFELSYEPHELIVIDGSLAKKDFLTMDISAVISEKQNNKPSKSVKIKPKERTKPALEVDLHIHQLVEKTKNLQPYDMLTIQLETAKRQLDFAISKRIQRVVFIHGIGEGILRADLEALFNRYDNLEYYDADYTKYGRGATEVYIFQNPR